MLNKTTILVRLRIPVAAHRFMVRSRTTAIREIPSVQGIKLNLRLLRTQPGQTSNLAIIPSTAAGEIQANKGQDSDLKPPSRSPQPSPRPAEIRQNANSSTLRSIGRTTASFARCRTPISFTFGFREQREQRTIMTLANKFAMLGPLISLIGVCLLFVYGLPRKKIENVIIGAETAIKFQPDAAHPDIPDSEWQLIADQFQKRAKVLNSTGFALTAIGTLLQMAGIWVSP